MNLATRAAKVLEQGADLIERTGWRRGGGGSCNTGFCVYDAIGWVLNHEQSNAKVHALAIRTVADIVNDRNQVTDSSYAYRAVILWNDNDARNLTEVTVVMRQAARRLRGEER